MIDDGQIVSLGERSYVAPDRPASGYSCRCRADINDNIPENAEKMPRYAFGEASGASIDDTVRKAKKEATKALGAQPKHVGCKCNPSQ
ncbi:hypothetical protein [uncultured Variovorax sp.]|uniref:hypothetical protein n=1 Tax=uncultured Variovorax sp. TaxID=114708 RepID=UPI0025DBE38D|nr:hypothetical protein [uncultured Variovorax sp.]